MSRHRRLVALPPPRRLRLRTHLLALLCLAMGFAASPARAHEVRPAYLEIREVEADVYDVTWKVPALGDLRLGIYVALPPEASAPRAKTGRTVGDAFIETWRFTCPGGLRGRAITIDGLAATKIDVLARVEHLGGAVQTARLFPGATTFTVAASPSWTGVAWSYFVIGVEHILFGIDHLLFVLALVLLVRSWRRLVETVTAFTVAHSITLALATLGVVHVPGPPVEAIIALSIVFVATEILHAQRGRPGLAQRRPWIVAFSFGLLHGLGFAGALSEVGLPREAVPTALLFFNVGVEAGQLAFVAVILATGRVVERAWRDRPDWTERLVPYAIGSVAMLWVIERVAGFA